MFSFIGAWINGWVNTREAGELRRHRAHYDVIVMEQLGFFLHQEFLTLDPRDPASPFCPGSPDIPWEEKKKKCY